MTVTTAELPDTIRRLKQEGYTRFVDVTAVDYPDREDRFELQYLLYHMKDHAWVRIKARTAGTAPTISHIFPGANAYEREVYDMYGVLFENHPMLRRILMPDEWVGYPLRRDEPIGGEEVQFTDRGPNGR